jgi:peptidoglycan/LPS O-acetylase OafA/YrhL
MALIALKLIAFPQTRDNLFRFPSFVLSLGVLANITFVGSDWLMFLKIEDSQVLFGNFQLSDTPIWHVLWVPQIWSLGIEITFYLMAPILCRMPIKRLVFLGSILLSLRFLGLATFLNYDPWTYRFFPFELPLFLIGILIERKKPEILNCLSGNPRFLLNHNFSRILTVLSFLFVGTIQIKNEWERLLLVILLISIVVIPTVLMGWPKWDKVLGELSYPIYISHMFVIATTSTIAIHLSGVNLIENIFHSKILWNLAQLFSVFVFSFLLYVITRPIERIRDRVRLGN